jgi:hypothetical protein
MAFAFVAGLSIGWVAGLVIGALLQQRIDAQRSRAWSRRLLDWSRN